MSLSEQKEQLRQQMKLATSRLTLSEREMAASLLKKRFLELLLKIPATRITLYYPIKAELDTRPLLKELLQREKEIGLPVCVANDTLEMRRVTQLGELVPAKFGLLEPTRDASLIRPETIEMILLPGLAFDCSGYRLGYGKGYYDRFLLKAPQAFKLGIGYDFQLMKEIPYEAHDIPVDAVLTPHGYWERSTLKDFSP